MLRSAGVRGGPRPLRTLLRLLPRRQLRRRLPGVLGAGFSRADILVGFCWLRDSQEMLTRIWQNVGRFRLYRDRVVRLGTIPCPEKRRTRSRLGRRRFLDPYIRFTTCSTIYKICVLVHRSKHCCLPHIQKFEPDRQDL